MRILKNKTGEAIEVTSYRKTVEIPANDQADLSETFSAWELAASESLLLLLASGADKYQLNDGSKDLYAGEAIDLIRGYQGPKKVTEAGVPIVQTELPEGRRCDSYTHNFCDKTSWYQGSQRNIDVELVDSGNHVTYDLPTPCIVVDVTHGKIFGEDAFLESYGVVVKVDDVEKAENSPGTMDGDYSVDYETGSVAFNVALAGTEVVEMTFSKVMTSLCTIKPPEGYKMRVGYVEVQVSKDFGLRDTLKFQLWGVDPEDPPNLIPYTAAEVYKTLDDFIIDSERAFPEIPALTGGDEWRMPTQPRIVFRFDYTSRAATDLLSAALMEIRVWLENDIPCDGEYAVGTFYGVRVAEDS